MKVIILAAGIGSRLGKPHPKPLTMLANGRSIMQHQIKQLVRYVSIEDIYIVVGFKKELIMEAFPEVGFIYNDYFDTTNTSKSLLRALKKHKGQDVLWLNGDVVFDHKVLAKVINFKKTCMAVNTSKVSDEEVKYTVDDSGRINQVSKVVSKGLGEAVGINFFQASDVDLLITQLEACNDNDYFERGIELAIQHSLDVYPVDISEFNCIEVDFLEDLSVANTIV